VRGPDIPPCGAKLYLPSTASDGRDLTVPCTVDFCGGNELRIASGEPLVPGSAVSVEYKNALLLGEVVRSIEQTGGWQHSIRLKQVLNGLMNIMALRSHLLEQAGKVSEGVFVSEP
jgi:hypothetical protein